MSEDSRPFPAEETIFVAALALQSSMGGGVVATAHSMSAAMSEDAAMVAATNLWRKAYPEYLAGSLATMKIRRAKMTNRFIFWEGFGAGLSVVPIVCAILLGGGMLISMVSR